MALPESSARKYIPKLVCVRGPSCEFFTEAAHPHAPTAQVQFYHEDPLNMQIHTLHVRGKHAKCRQLWLPKEFHMCSEGMLQLLPPFV